jgi:hypothetical protein
MSMKKLAWILLIAANIADAVTFCGCSPAAVAEGEQNMIARTLGAGLPGALGAKLAMTLIVVSAVWIMRRFDAPRWVQPIMVLSIAAVALFGAYTNVAIGHAFGA